MMSPDFCLPGNVITVRIYTLNNCFDLHAEECGGVFWPHMLAMTDSGGNHKAIGGSSSQIEMWFNNVLI